MFLYISKTVELKVMDRVLKLIAVQRFGMSLDQKLTISNFSDLVETSSQKMKMNCFES